MASDAADDTSSQRSSTVSSPAIMSTVSMTLPTQTRFSFYEPEEVELQISTENKDDEKKEASTSRYSFHEDSARLELAAVENNLPFNSSMDTTDEILRSLQETEEQRLNILKVATEPLKANKLPQTAVSSPPNSKHHEGENGSNPYEDAIKEALDLLRKHRSPPGTPATTAVVGPPKSVEAWERPRTPREQDRLLQLRMDDDDGDGTSSRKKNIGIPEDLTDAYEEHKLKAKQRQERMAQYASRLQEFKSSLPAETVEHWHQIGNTQSNVESNVKDDSPIPHVTSHNDESVGFSDLSQSTKQQVDEEVQRGVERVLLAILERASNSRGRAEAESHGSSSKAKSPSSVNDALVRAMDELGLRQTSTSRDSADSKKLKTKSSTETGNSKRSTERSVVEDLLAEVDEEDALSFPSNMASPASNHAAFGQWPREEKKLPDSHEKAAAYEPIEEEGTEIDQIDTEEEGQNLSVGSDEEDDDEEGETSDAEDDDDDDEEDSYEESGDDESHNDTSNLSGVLGPLSKKAGGTTGVVLDLELDDIKSQESSKQPYLGAFSSVMSYVTSALTPDQHTTEQSEAGDKYSVDLHGHGHGHEEDIEAEQLMRTLCAHLLPFGVDQSNLLLETVPDWDETNPNEAGYRIIRLTKPQLRRVEKAFEAMINGLKANSERRLNGSDGAGLDFDRELLEAERLLDDEEKRLKIETAQKMVQAAAGATAPKQPSPAQSDFVEGATDGHPDFPGVKGTGKGEMGDLEYFHLPIIFKSHVTGFEPTKDLVLEPGNVVAGQYLVESELGSAAFSTAYRCIDLSSEGDEGHEEVCLKVIKNTKDFFDQSLDEIKILELLRQTGKVHENFIVEMKCFFYYREHLIIVTELLRQNLFEFGKFILDNDEEPYFTIPRLAYITRQVLVALRFVHSLGLVHSDVKPENILLGSYSRAQVKLIDFGSSCYLTDRQSSYIQSRSYRAPEVVLGLPYDGKIDIWSLGCVVAEMFTGEVTFQNDSIVSMLSRIEAICGPFPRHMIAQGRQSGRFFTKSGLLYEVVEPDGRDATKPSPGPHDDDNGRDRIAQFDIFQPKNTRLSSRLGFDADLMEGFSDLKYRTHPTDPERQEQQMFTDFVRQLLTIDPDARPTAEEALMHPWMLYAASLTEEQIKYPSS